ncbi:hypothetical protein COD67_07870 [Bacillus cereus]|nr:hypothetical protein COI89_18925 [Bacillus cereus]PGU68065.1 hypothetical protein COD67_07870 [Bacillus cereus]
MTITQLQVLIKTVELGSFTKAEKILNMTQPAVSHAISSIEVELDVVILIRDKREGLIVTDVGERILAELSLTNLPSNVQTRELEPQVWREIALAVPSLKEASIAVQLFIEEFKVLFKD